MRRALPVILVMLVAATLSTSPHALTSIEPLAAQDANNAGAPATPQAPPPPLGVVVVDPAHGGSDSGARGASGVAESEIVLDFARAIRTALDAAGFRVVLTREGNQDPSFDDRSALVNGFPDAVFISLHVSSTGPFGTARAYSYRFSDSPLGNLAETPATTQLFAPRRAGLLEWDLAQKTYLPRSQRLAELAQIQLAQKLEGSPETPTQVPVRQLRTIAAPAIAIEVSSVAGVADAKKLTQLSQPLAASVARTILDYRAAVRGDTAATGTEH